MLRLLTVCLFITVIATKAQAWTCWLPDGKSFDNVGMIPCNSTLEDTTEGSACCDPRDACTTSGMCLGESGYTYRGGCTDSTFTSSNCPSYCLTDPVLNTRYNRNANLYSCGDTGMFTTAFCCGSYSDPVQDCCKSSFAYPGSGYAFRPGWDAEKLLLAAANDSTVTITSAVATATVTATVTFTATAGAAAATCSNSNSDLGTAVGAGVGVPLAVGVIGLLAFLFWRERNNKPKQNNMAKSLDVTAFDGGEPLAWARQHKYGGEPRIIASEAPTEVPTELHGSN